MTDTGTGRPAQESPAGRSAAPVQKSGPAAVTGTSVRAAGPAAVAGAAAAAGSGAAEQGSAHKWWTLVAVCLGTFMLLLDVTIINVALPDIQVALGSSFSALQWIIDAYALTLAALLLTTGSLADLYGRRRLYIVGLVVFTAASLLCGVAQSTLMLQLSRAAQGVGGAIMFSVSLALLAGAFRGKDRGTAFAVWGAVTGLAVALGPLLGGILTSGLSWRWIFFINLPVGLVAVFITLTQISESRVPQATRPDWVGFVVFTAALTSLVFGLIESNQRSFGDPPVLTALLIAAVLLGVFVAVERRGRHPMLDLTLFAKPTFTGGAIAAFGLSSTLFAMLLYLTLYLQNVLRLSPLQTGVRLVVLSGAILITATVAGRLSSHVPVRLLIGPGLLLVGVGLLLMRGLTATSTWTHLIPGLVAAGVGAGLVNPPLASTAVGVVSPDRAGMASGINSTFRQVGIATGIALLGTLFGSRVSSSVLAGVTADPRLTGVGPRAVLAVQSGKTGQLINSVPPELRDSVATLTKTAFTTGLNRILLLGAVGAFLSAVASLVLIRTKDFVSQTATASGH